MKKQLMSWCSNLTDRTKLERLVRTSTGSFIAATVVRVAVDENEKFKFNASVMNDASLNAPTTPGAHRNVFITKSFDTAQLAKDFVDHELRRQGYNF